VGQHSAFVDDEGRANDPHHGLPIHGLLAKGPIGVVNDKIRVTQQGEGQALLRGKHLKSRALVLRNS
jgi:hypothetical protein